MQQNHLTIARLAGQLNGKSKPLLLKVEKLSVIFKCFQAKTILQRKARNPSVFFL